MVKYVKKSDHTQENNEGDEGRKGAKERMIEGRISQLRREIRYFKKELEWRYEELKVLKEEER